MVVQARPSEPIRFGSSSLSRCAAKIRLADGLIVAGYSSEDEDGWRVHERYCIDHRAAFDMHEIVNDVFMSAIAFMHNSGLRMDEDHVGKPEDLYLWCLVGSAKNWGLWGCPMLVPAPSRRGII